MASYVEDLSPGGGSRTPARAWVATDAPSLSLNGDWRFRLHATHHRLTDDLADPALDDSDWARMAVPSHWVLPAFHDAGAGAYGSPSYTNVQYPFPIDVPYVPDENPTADHRRTFQHPGWDAERVLLRFDGVESVYKVWLNGSEIGVGKGSRLVCEFDVTDALRPGTNVLAVRVHQWSSMSYIEDQDQWWLPGIFRDVTLLARPAGAIDDVWLECGFAGGRGTIRAEVTAAGGAWPVTVAVEELGFSATLDGPGAAPVLEVGEVEPWTAESPRLYDATVTSRGERVSLRIGFRTVEIAGGLLLVNGAPVTFRGMNRHETHAELGRVHDPEYARRDLLLMKRHGVNAVRTSHYPPHPEVLALFDELGFWVIDECDIETHGFVFQNWVGNPSDDPRFAEVYLDRIRRTVERDKNHASVIIWSLGNEAGTGRNLAANADWVHQRDPGRPVHYEGDYRGAYTDVYSRMYPNFHDCVSIAGTSGFIPDTGPGDGPRIRRKPFIMCEYAHAMGNGPGGLARYDELVEQYPRFQGGFVWEWRDHGLLTHTEDGTPYYGYGGDFGEVVHDGNFVMDGMVLPDGTPTPGLAEFAATNAPVVISVSANGSPAGRVSIHNRRHSATTSDLRFVAVVESDGEVASEATLEVPAVAAGDRVEIELPEVLAAESAEDGSERWLTIRAELAADTAWAPAGHVVAWAQHTLTTAARSTPWLGSSAGDHGNLPDGPLRLGPAVLDPGTGQLTELAGLVVGGPSLELWRGPTDNDRSEMRGSFELGTPEDTLGEGAPGPSSEARWRERGLNRLVTRVLSVSAGGGTATIRTRVGAANSSLFVEVDYRWRAVGEDAVALRVDIAPSPGWDCTWPRVGAHLVLPGDLTRATWFGTGPLESYPDTRAAARVGRFTADVDELCVRYSRPQETGHRAELRHLVLENASGPALVIRTRAAAGGHRPGFTLTRHTPQELDAARHPYELPGTGLLHLYLDDAVHGVGSRACGVDVLPEHALWPGARAFTVVFERP